MILKQQLRIIQIQQGKTDSDMAILLGLQLDVFIKFINDYEETSFITLVRYARELGYSIDLTLYKTDIKFKKTPIKYLINKLKYKL